jgi:hypothetical protein
MRNSILVRSLDRQVRRLFALENTAHIAASQVVGVDDIAAVADQAPSHNKCAACADRWHYVPGRQRGKLSAPAHEDCCPGTDHKNRSRI